MNNYQNDTILKMINGETTDRFPVWLMRQAGRILPEYRAVRKSIGGFKELVETPEKAAEVTIQPVDILGVDAAIIFSDILVVPEAMGLPYQLIEKKGHTLYFLEFIISYLRSCCPVARYCQAIMSCLHNFRLNDAPANKKRSEGGAPTRTECECNFEMTCCCGDWEVAGRGAGTVTV